MHSNNTVFNDLDLFTDDVHLNSNSNIRIFRLNACVAAAAAAAALFDNVGFEAAAAANAAVATLPYCDNQYGDVCNIRCTAA
ncbi:hypothetical protein DERP_008650 [Dermatophagoides pteronyssinus]|uniref:Uncharacterized protein n=1 Tax=Dermatophagoides pteronyssinus TaxID=6956 RepID=A0ABQ8IWW9_DERPT|nr:hypothetical protein DERP_008650 [Dermatophagoides pteronyssinus]